MTAGQQSSSLLKNVSVPSPGEPWGSKRHLRGACGARCGRALGEVRPAARGAARVVEDGVEAGRALDLCLQKRGAGGGRARGGGEAWGVCGE